MAETEIWRSYQELHQNNPRSDSAAKVDYYNKNSEFIKRSSKIPDPDLSIIIPAYNESILLPRTLAGINAALKEFPDKANLIVVNNASEDDTKSIAEAFGALVVDETEKGIGRARQTGLESVSSSVKYILTTDADSLVSPNWINNHHQALNNSGVVFTYGEFEFCFDLNNSLKNECLWKAYQLFRFIKTKVKTTKPDYVCGALNNGFNKDVASTVGGYNPNLARGEDYDIRDKILKIGKLQKVENAKVLTSNRRIIGKGLAGHLVKRIKNHIIPVKEEINQTSEFYEDYR